MSPDQYISSLVAYLRNLTHQLTVCDRCMSHIRGEWFHCAYCPKDLCDSCAEVDTHDPTHLFVVFKSNVNMQIFRYVCFLSSPTLSPPCPQLFLSFTPFHPATLRCADLGNASRRFINEEDSSRSPPLIPFPVYHS